jgi:hypothetical protein
MYDKPVHNYYFVKDNVQLKNHLIVEPITRPNIDDDANHVIRKIVEL